MSFLTIAGHAVPVAPDGAREDAIERIGSESRAYAGNLRSTVRSEKRSWVVRTRALTSGEESTIRTDIASGAFVTVSGDLLSGASVTCSVALTDATSVLRKGGFRNVLTLAIRQT